MPLDIRDIFKEVSDQLLSEFRKTSGVGHPGGKGGLREDAFREFLSSYLPARYAVGPGQVIAPTNHVSGQLDVVIYDPLFCPRLIASNSHSIFPVESVYGAISMKSNLDSEELKDGYKNIVSLKSILPRQGFSHKPTDGVSIGMARPTPVTGVLAYSANRSLDAIASQVLRLDEELPDVSLRPDFVAVIGQGIIAPRGPLRTTFNNYELPDVPAERSALRRTGRHTLLRVYMQMLRELNTITLRPLDLHEYDKMPRLIGEHRVEGYYRFVSFPRDRPNEKRVVRFSKNGIVEIVTNSREVTFAEHMKNRFGEVNTDHVQAAYDPNHKIYEYNPKNHPPISMTNMIRNEDGSVSSDIPAFQPLSILIDGKSYAVDIDALGDDHIEDDPDFTVEELMSS